MQTRFTGKTITALLGVLPETVGLFDDEVENYSFPPKQTLRLKKVMGYDRHRLAKPGTTVSGLALRGIRYMLDNCWVRREEIGAVLVATLCPDHFVPHISNILHGELGLAQDVLCMDIPQGCCGFLLGLMQAFLLLEHMEAGKKVLLVNGDVLSHKVSPRDRNDFPLIGDGASVAIVENDPDAGEIWFELNTDGARRNALLIPAGGFRMPSTAETAVMKDMGDGNFRALDHMHMDGSAVFNFVQTEVPPMLAQAFARAHVSVEDFDLFLFHQPNKFMLQKLAEKAKLPFEKLPMNLVENYGNPSGASIPLTAILNCRDALLAEKKRCCLTAFGSGLSWGTVLMDLGPLEYCEMLETDL